MTVEKTFSDFMILHEKKIISKDIKSLEKDISITIGRVLSIPILENESGFNEAEIKLMEGITDIKKILNKYNLYEL